MNSAPVVSVHNFKMNFGQKTVVENLSFEVAPGQVFGFLGSNGSGKTTTIRALLGIYEPTAGELLVFGRRFSPDQAALLGYLPEERGLYKKETVLTTMLYFGELKGLGRSEARKRAMSYLERVGLADKMNEKLEKLSGGQQQKVQLGMTIMNRPKLLILDEPTKGFDPVNRRLMMDIIAEHAAEGATIILVTHHMEEVERAASHVLLLKDGVRRLYGPIDEVKRAHGREHIYIRFSGDLPSLETLAAVEKPVPGTASITPHPGIDPQEILQTLVRAPALKIGLFEIRYPSLDDIFVELYRT